MGEQTGDTVNGSSPVPETISEQTDQCDGSALSAAASSTNNLPDASGQHTDAHPSETKMRDKLRKLSAPFPMCGGGGGGGSEDFGQPPKISPRKMSAPPPILASSAKCATDSKSSGAHKAAKKHKSDATGFGASAHGVSNKVDNKSAANEQCATAGSDSIKSKNARSACDERAARLRRRSPAIDGTAAKTSKRATAPDAKTKSRRLSEFTRGEFLNEKL